MKKKRKSHKLCEETKEKLRAIAKEQGRRPSYEAVIKSVQLRMERPSEEHPNYKGKEVGYRALHHWVELRLGKPSFCEDCKRTEAPKGKGAKRSYFQWANLSGKYFRDVRDWRRLCYKCHKKFDKEKLCS